ncbi:hypothetical protein H9P43_001626 [Blastocladiella emersonii ATCC 22665]|nr:hypothetical protein H9P43_001626 [Blastocladiella emersonii ATCC 22665]
MSGLSPLNLISLVVRDWSAAVVTRVLPRVATARRRADAADAAEIAAAAQAPPATTTTTAEGNAMISPPSASPALSDLHLASAAWNPHHPPHDHAHQHQRQHEEGERRVEPAQPTFSAGAAGSAGVLFAAMAAATSSEPSDAAARSVSPVQCEAAAPVAAAPTTTRAASDSVVAAMAATLIDPLSPLAADVPLVASDAPYAMTPPSQYAGYRVAAHYEAPLHPIVLCHGLFGFDRKGPDMFPQLQVHYWRGISDALRDAGAKLYIARVPSAGNVHSRAQALRDFLERNQIRDANLVAHSMGGLDCRYMLAKLGAPPGTRVHSLTTISTPHRGSPMMDWFAMVFGVSKNLGHEAHHPDVEALRRFDPYRSHPLARLMAAVDFPAYANLTTWYATHIFNPAVPDVDGVQYFSYGASYPIPAWAPLRIPYEIVKAKEGENDGLVSLDSARWGTWLGVLPADHWGVRGAGLSARLNRDFDVPGFYLSHATKLSRLGF